MFTGKLLGIEKKRQNASIEPCDKKYAIIETLSRCIYPMELTDENGGCFFLMLIKHCFPTQQTIDGAGDVLPWAYNCAVYLKYLNFFIVMM